MRALQAALDITRMNLSTRRHESWAFTRSESVGLGAPSGQAPCERPSSRPTRMKRKENAMATGTVNSQGTPLNKRSGPGTNYPVVGSVPDGTTVTIVCQTTGTTETGDWGATDLWDCLDDNTYVSDAFVYTGTNDMIAPPCNGTPQQPGGTIQQRLDKFVSDWEGNFLNYDDSVLDQCFSVAQAWAKEYLGLHDFTGEYAAGIIDQGGSDF